MGLEVKKMKYAVLVGDGMGDYPINELGERTPLEVAKTLNMDTVARKGQVGIAQTIPKEMLPGSDVANLAILGYDPGKYYAGRAGLEAANIGVTLEKGDVALRCNLITIEEDKIIDYSAGHISTKEARIVIEFLNQRLGSGSVQFYPGVSYRHLLVIKGAPEAEALLQVKCIPPHNIIGQSVSRNLPQGDEASLLRKLMQDSRTILAEHEINNVRIDLKENPANMIWLWGQGVAPNMPKFSDKYGIQGAVISAVDLVKGIGKSIGMESIEVPGATGYYDTDYLAKANYGIKALEDKDFVFIHVEAPDEAGHNGELREKISAIEKFDRLVVGTFLRHFEGAKDFRVMVLPDHYTPISLRSHTDDPIFFAICGEGIRPDEIKAFNERAAKESRLKFDRGHELMEYFIQGH